MTYDQYDSRRPEYQLDQLQRALRTDNMGAVRIALIELLDIGYMGNHADDIDPYKHIIVKTLLTYVKNENYHVADAVAFQLGELGVVWPELTIIRKSIASAKDR